MKIRDLMEYSPTNLKNTIQSQLAEFLKKSVPNFDPNFFSTRRQQTSVTGAFNFDRPYEQSVWIFAATRKISQNVSQSPYMFFIEQKDSQKQILSNDHAINRLFNNPNPLMSRQELIFSTMVYMGLDGESFWVLDRDSEKQIPKNIWNFRKNFFKPEIDKTTGLIQFWNFEGNPKKLAVENVIHFKYFNPDNHYRGMPPWKSAELAGEQDYFASNYNTNFFKEGAAIGGFVEVEEELQDEQYDRLISSLEDKHVGHTKAHRLMLLEGGAKFKEAKISQRDMEFINTKKLSKLEILAAYGTNPVVLGDFSEVKSEAGVKTIFKDYWNSVVIPNQNYLEEKMYTDFLNTLNPNLKVFFDNSNIEILQEDRDILLERAKKLFEMGYPLNEINRSLNLNMPSIDCGDSGYLPFNLTSVCQLGQTEDEEKKKEDNTNEEIKEDAEEKKIKSLKQIDGRRTQQREYERDQRKAEKKFLKSIRKYFKDQEKEVIKKLNEIPLTVLISQFKSKQLEDQLFDDTEEIKKLDVLLSPLWEELFEQGFDTVVEDLNLDISFSPLNENFLKFQDFKVTKISPSIFETVKKGVINALNEGLKERETIKELAERIQQVYDFADRRAITIARTESTSSLNAGRLEMYKTPEAEVNRIRWITARDENVRGNKPKDLGNHVLLDNQTAIPGRFFVRSDGVKTRLKHPGDNTAPAFEVINCRCVVVEDFEELDEE